MVGEMLKHEIRSAVGNKQREAQLNLLRRCSEAANDIAQDPYQMEAHIAKHSRAVVAICLASTIRERTWRLDGWEVRWANEILDLLPNWTESRIARTAIHDEKYHPTRICEYAGKYIDSWKERGAMKWW